MPTLLLQFVHRLRGSGVPVSMVEAIDAAEAIRRVPVTDREVLRCALASTLVKGSEDGPVFDSTELLWE